MDAMFPLISGSGSEPEEIPRSLSYATPTPPTSHASAKLNRREMNISETSTDSAGSVEIATTEKFRVGAPSPLRMLPLIEHLSDPASQASQAFVDIESRIKGVFLQRRVNYHMRLCRLSEPEDEPVDSDHTILISMEYREDWAGITNDILEITHQAQVQHLFHIELRDSRARLKFFVPDKSQSLEMNWAAIRLQILDILRLSPHWRSLDIFNTGLDQETSRPTVVIGLVRPVHNTFQRMLKTSIHRILEPYEGWELTFVRAPKALTAFNSPPTFVPAKDFGGKVYMGAGMGIKGSAGHGTLGGFLVVNYDDQNYIMGLTNHHVVQHNGMTSGMCPPKIIMMKLDFTSNIIETKLKTAERSHGLQPSISREPIIIIPSTSDQKKTLEKLRSLRQELEDRINRGRGGHPSLQAQVEMLGVDAPQAKIDHLAELKDWSHEKLVEIETVTNANLTAGRIFASSGQQRYCGDPWDEETDQGSIRTGWATDWALVLLDKTQIGGNLLELDAQWKNSVLLGATAFNSPLDNDTRRYEIPNDEEAFAIGDFIFKKGRSGQTAGIVSHIKTDLLLDNMHFTAYAVLAHEENRGLPFLEAGDSGSWCLDRIGAFHSLAFGGSKDASTGYVISRELIYKDIEEQTGAKIVGVYKLGPQQ
ncbi:MAG: hypothetical protein M1814_005244 [Vezdaea aestivalis]|nr:MAG: hypothetical protein M1814_005244 [Vezdaea aestivalis]